MQNFNKVTQGNHKKVPSFATRLEGTLNQIIKDSIRYLHSNPEITYLQLMVAARKAESEMEDAKEKVRARSSNATEVTDS